MYFSAKQPFLPETHHKSHLLHLMLALWPPHCHLYQTSHPLVLCCLIDAIAADGWAAPVWPKSRVTCGTACFRLYMYTFNAFPGILLSVGTAHRVLPKFTVACLPTEGAGNSYSWGNCYLANMPTEVAGNSRSWGNYYLANMPTRGQATAAAGAIAT